MSITAPVADSPIAIGDLADHLAWLPEIARWHCEQWGPLTGARAPEPYRAWLAEAATSRAVPSVLVAVAGAVPLGSASLVAADLSPGPALTPWVAQVFVEPTRRRTGTRAALVRAVLERARRSGCARGYLCTWGTLPARLVTGRSLKGDLLGEPLKGTVPALDEIAKFLPAGRAGGR